MRRYLEAPIECLLVLFLWLSLFDPVYLILALATWIVRNTSRDPLWELNQDRHDTVEIFSRHVYGKNGKRGQEPFSGKSSQSESSPEEADLGVSRVDQNRDEEASVISNTQDSSSQYDGDGDDVSLPEEPSRTQADYDQESINEETTPPGEDEPPTPTESEIIRDIWASTAKCKVFDPLHLCLRCTQAGHIMKDCPLAEKSFEYSWSLQQLLMEQIAEDDEDAVQQLCQRCEGIGILRKFDTWDPYAYNDTQDIGDTARFSLDRKIAGFFSLGNAESVIFRKDCPLCRVLFALSPRSPPAKEELLIVPSWTVHRFEPGLKVPWDADLDYAICLYIGHKPIHPSIWEKLTLPSESLDAICLVGEDYCRKTTLGGTKIDGSHLNIDLINGWISHCHQLHKSTCRPKFFQDLLQIRLVDVRTRKVVCFSREQHREYLALSYVWGNVIQPSVRVGVTLGKLPSTIEDCMIVVRKLGKRYLWIDSLCIDQGDNAHKLTQIAAMSSIYRGAWATIVVLSGDSAEAGLPKVNPNVKIYPQLTCQIDGKRLVSTMPTLAQQIEKSPWGTRAWTLQEALLSPRCLYFTQSQIYFECNVMQCCESLDESDSPIHLRTDKVRKQKHSAPKAELGVGVLRNPTVKLPNLYEESFAKRPRLETYGDLLKTYSARKMTDDSDALNAFSGVLQHLSQVDYTEGGFHFGIPVADFPYALKWDLKGKARRRDGFPSWSWAGWEGSLRNAYDPTLYVEDWIQPALHVWKVRNDALVQLYSRVPIFDEDGRTSMFAIDPIRDLAFSESRDPAFDILKHPGAEASSLLFIEGITIRLSLGGLRKSSDGLIGSHTTRHAIPVRLGYRDCELSWHNKALHKELWKRANREQEFLVLARDLYMSDVFFSLMLLGWKGGVAFRVGVMLLAVDYSRLEVVADARPRRRRIVLG